MPGANSVGRDDGFAVGLERGEPGVKYFSEVIFEVVFAFVCFQ